MNRAGARRRLLAPALAALLLSACVTPGSGPDANAPAVPVPAAEAGGAAYGRLMDAEGLSVPGGSVVLSQPFKNNIITLSFQFISLGLFCVIPDSGLCPTSHGADLTDDGLWTVPTDEVDPDKAMVLGGRGPGGAGASGAQTSVALPNGPVPRHVPDLVLWEPKVTVGKAKGGTRVAWSRLTDQPHGKAVAYAVFVKTGDPTFADPVEVASGLRRTSAVIPGWQTEDQAITVTVVAETRRGKAHYSYTSPSAKGEGQAVPLSRGKPCTTDRGGHQVRGVGTCGLTDGVLDSHVQVRLKGECDVNTSGCKLPQHHRICVDLGKARTVSRVVVRTPFQGVDQVVELSRDGRSFSTQGRLGDGNDVFSVPTRPTTARFACIRSDAYGYSGATTSEISVW